MSYISLHSIVNSILLKKGYPVHFYAQYLVYAAAGLKELHFDTLKQIKTATMEGELEYCLPSDYLDWVRFGFAHDYCNEYSDTLVDCDCYGNKVDSGMYWRYGHWFGMWHREKVEISDGKLKVNRTSKWIMDYLSDGTSIDNATRITPYAQDAIEKYSDWQYKEHSRAHTDREAAFAEQRFDKAHTKLRARLNDITLDDIKDIVRRGANTPIKL